MLTDKLALAWADAAKQPGGWHPLDGLKSARKTRWMVDGVIPANSIVWVTGKPACGKTFAMLDIAACVSSGRPWHGRPCEQATVIYVAAEGGDDIHVRRAAAEMAAGTSGPLNIVQARPRLDEPEGLAEIMALLQFSTGEALNIPGSKDSRGLQFDAVDKVMGSVIFNRSAAHLSPEELQKFDVQERYRDLLDRHNAGDRLSKLESDELATFDLTLAMWERDYDLLSERMQDLAASRLAGPDKAMYKHFDAIRPIEAARSKRVLLIIDTYSQTAADDVKASVSRYIKNLRDLGELVERQGGTLTVIVVDHLTKSGDSFMGSMAKQGDSDAMIEVERKGNLVVLTCPDKLKAARPFDPIHLELAPYVLGDEKDSQGRPLTSLVIRDGEKIHRLREAAGASGETAAALLLDMLDKGGPHTRDELRAQFTSHASNKDKKPDSARRSFSRTLDGLIDDEVVTEVDGVVSFSLV